MRIRTIKPEFWSHPVICKLDDSTRLAAIGLLNIADDEGYFLASAPAVRSALWPFDEDSTKARRALATLTAEGYIEVREHPSHGPIGQVLNFRKHQRIDRPSDSKIKVYFLDEYSTNVRRVLDEHSLLEQGTGNREQGKEHKGAGKPPRSVFVPPTPAEVDVYSAEIGYPMNGQAWCDSYAQKGWVVGKAKMKDWKAAVRNWKSQKWTPSAIPAQRELPANLNRF